jgi:5-methylcytosine-specific restriction endonuclease McrA
MFGHKCPECSNYWRARFSSSVCPYCGFHGSGQSFLTDAQRRYVRHCCELLRDALTSDQDGDHVIDMDAVADAAGKDFENPPFYYSEERQQHQFRCAACDQTSDILGRYGYCSVCGTRNDLAEFEKDIASLRDRINSGAAPEACCMDAVSGFDSFVAQYAKQLSRLLPMTPSRLNRIEKMRFYNLDLVREEFRGTFDIDILAGFSFGDTAFAELMFHRRHVYKHNGGEADAKYIADSGDTSVREKQMLRET